MICIIYMIYNIIIYKYVKINNTECVQNDSYHKKHTVHFLKICSSTWKVQPQTAIVVPIQLPSFHRNSRASQATKIQCRCRPRNGAANTTSQHLRLRSTWGILPSTKGIWLYYQQTDLPQKKHDLMGFNYQPTDWLVPWLNWPTNMNIK